MATALERSDFRDRAKRTIEATGNLLEDQPSIAPRLLESIGAFNK